VGAGIEATVVEVVERVRRVLVAWRAAEQALRDVAGAPVFEPAVADMREQVDDLVYNGFVTDTGWARLPDVERYLRGVERRVEKLPRDLDRDEVRMAVVGGLTDEWRALLADVPPGEDPDPRLAEIRWMLEELRVSLFAQTLGTAHPVSEKRVRRVLDAAR
jgi:ATP-dependent helicase HrpA